VRRGIRDSKHSRPDFVSLHPSYLLRGLVAELPEDGEKPKWMRWRTYERIGAEIEEADHCIEEAWLPGAARLFQRLGISLPE